MSKNGNSKAARRTAARKRIFAGTGMLLTGFGAAFAQGPPLPGEAVPHMLPHPHAPRVPLVPPPPDFFAPPPILRVRDFSWAYVGIPEPREILVHDIITIIVNEKAEVNAQSKFNRQRTGNLKAELKEFMRFDDDGHLATAAPNQPTIDTNLQGRLQSAGQLAEQEGTRFRIAATVVDVLPNGNIVLEARKTIRTNKDVWKYSLTGVVRPQDIQPDNTVLSENIALLETGKDSRGKVSDSTKRPWGIRLYDAFSPF